MAMKILVLEDDLYEVKRLESAIKAIEEFELVAIVNSVKEALLYMSKEKVEALIVDIELNKGLGGSGLDFLRELNQMDLIIRPLIFVTTRNESEAIHNACRAQNIDMIYYKSKEDYSPNIILNQFLTLRPYMSKAKVFGKKSKIETEVDMKNRVSELIKEELYLIGIPPQMKGFTYLYEAILYLLLKKDRNDLYYTKQLSEKFNVRKGGISTSIQDAINNAWRNTAEEDILENFTANISYNKGAPTPMQFIHYYVEKISRMI